MTIDTDADTETGADLPPLRVRGLDDLVQAIPYLLGFHPVASLVAGRAGRRHGSW